MEPTKWLVIDTETSGMIDRSLPADDPAQPHMAALAMITVELDGSGAGDIIRATEYLIKPDGWKMEADASAINGLTDEILAQRGIDIGVALDAFEACIRTGRPNVASFGAQFDLKIVRGAFRRAGRNDLFELTPNTCLMFSAQKLCKKLIGNGKSRTLSETHRVLFGAPHANAHSAMADCEAHLAILRKLMSHPDCLIPPVIHYAKEKPERLAGIGAPVSGRGPGF